MSADQKAPFAFVSYAHEDAPIVLQVIEAIVSEGYPIWFDKGINVSSTWSDEVGQAIMDCDVFIAFISKESIASKYVRSEIELALNKAKRIIPVYLDGIDILPPGLALSLNATQGVVGKKSAKDVAERVCAGLAFAFNRERLAKAPRKNARRVAIGAAIVAFIAIAAAIGGWYFFGNVSQNMGPYKITIAKSIYLPAEPMVVRIAEVTQEMIDNQAIVGVWERGANSFMPYSYAYLKDGAEVALRAPQTQGVYEVRAYASDRSVRLEAIKARRPFSVAQNSLGAFDVTLDRSEYERGEPMKIVLNRVPLTMLADGASVGVYRAGARSGAFRSLYPIRDRDYEVDENAPEEPGSYEVRAYSNDGIWTAETLVSSTRFTVK